MRESDKMVLEKNATKAFSDARARLLMGKGSERRDNPDLVFWAHLALGMDHFPAWNIPTACTNGKHIKYNPHWWMALTDQERVGVCAHEVGHCALAHMARLGHRNPKKANIAMDLALNPLLRQCGLILPKGALFPGLPPYEYLKNGECWETYYTQIPDPPKGGEDGNQPGDGECSDPGGCGEVEDGTAGSEEQQRQIEAIWKAKLAAAADAALAKGDVSGALREWLGKTLENKLDWRDILRQFIRDTFDRDDYSWRKPNRMYLPMGLYLPSLFSETIGGITVAVDSSGSIDDDQLAEFQSELQALASAVKSDVTILYHHTTVYHTQHWSPTSGELIIEAKETGGTSHQDVFAKIEQFPKMPTCLVVLSDMYSDLEHISPPTYPVLFVTTTHLQGPWGETVSLQ